MRVLVRNAATLYGVHVLGLVVPLLTVPYLARVLRPEGWGMVLFAQSFAAWMTLVLEYGFDLSGTRAVARIRQEPGTLPGVVAGIQGARITVLVVTQLLLGVAFLALPAPRAHVALFAWAWAFAVAKGLSPLWFFFGQERMRGAAAVDAGARVLAALGVFVWVQGPDDGWRVLALQAVTAGAALVWLTVRMYRNVQFRLPNLAESWATLHDAFGIFLFRSASGLYVNANAFILGLLATPAVVGFFGGAERIIRAAVNLFYPLSQALFPRLSHLTATDPRGAERLLGYGLLVMVGAGAAMGAVAVAAAPFLVSLLLGPGYEAAVPVLRTLALLPPVIAVGTIFGIQWALPAGLERPFIRLVLAAGALNLALAPVVVPIWGAQGMAWTVVTAEVLVAGGLLAVFRSRGGRLWPFRIPAPES